MADRPGANRPRPAPAGRVPPHNLDAEQSLLGAMLLRPDAISASVEVLAAQGAEAFYKPAHGLIYDAITSLAAEGQAVDPITVAEELRRAGVLDQAGGLAFMVELTTTTPAISNAAHYARIVDENALLRRLIMVAGDIAELGYSLPDDVAKAIDQAESMVFQIAERRVVETTKGLHELLGEAFDHLQELYERGDTITGLPTGYTDLDELLSGLQPSTLNIVGARPAMGKCVAWDTPILDPITGAVTTTAALYAAGVAGAPVDVAALTDDGAVVAVTPSVFVDDGIKPVHAVHTALGRYVRTTASHPFLTPQGWRPLADLQPGSRIAVPARLPFFGPDKLPGNEVAVLAHRLATAGLSTSDDRELEAAVLRGTAAGIDVIDTLQRHGIWRVAPDELDLPAALFCVPAEQVEDFLERLTDSNRRARAGDEDVAFVARSPRLARSVAHLHLRLGRVVECASATLRAGGDPIDVVEVRLLGRRDRRLADAPTRDVMWDEIVEIGPPVDEQVYDLTVPDLHNFVAADVFVHNTAFALGMATHAAVEHRSPVLFFSLEMGHRELTQRILASESRVDSQKMRTGKLNEQDWTKISKALGRLEAPLYIDDNPNLSVMDIRAKARRIMAGSNGLGLIVVDYIQLMSGRSNAENRQVEVAEMSRSLKILARELAVPIVALSQLSRNLEQRADKRPMLQDLRESGSLEQDADVVMFLYRDEVYNPDSADVGTAEVIVAKHRSGPIGTRKLAFISTYTKFANMARGV